MNQRVRINLANSEELQEIPGIGPQQARAIARFRAEHGPITDAEVLARLLQPWSVTEAVWQWIDYSPSDGTAPEAPGA